MSERLSGPVEVMVEGQRYVRKAAMLAAIDELRGELKDVKELLSVTEEALRERNARLDRIGRLSRARGEPDDEAHEGFGA